MVSSCATDPKRLLLQQAGITVCKAASVKMLKDEHGDVFKFRVSASDKECAPSLSDSIVQASKGDCRDLIRSKGACSYNFGHKTVIAEKGAAADGQKIYMIRTWE